MCRSETCSTPLLCPVLPPDTMPSHQLSKPMKPRLPRKLAASARINLNKYWHVLEELMPIGRKSFDESDCNAINDNIDNERRLAEMQLCDGVDGSRGEPSMAELRSKTDDQESSMELSSSPAHSGSIPHQKTITDNSSCLNTLQDSSSSGPSSECSNFLLIRPSISSS